MKKMTLKMRLFGGLIGVATALLAVSCAQGFNEHETFERDVTNSQVESLTEADVAINMGSSSTGEVLTITWPVKTGAKGYEVYAAITTDPENPVELYSAVLDRTQFSVPLYDDTEYEFRILPLGDETLNNTDAAAPVVLTYFYGVEGISVPEGEEIGSFINNYLAANADELAASRLADPNFEIAFDLAVGGHYTISTSPNFGVQPARLRGMVVPGKEDERVTVDMTASINTAAGLRVTNINFDCSDFIDYEKPHGFIMPPVQQYAELLIPAFSEIGSATPNYRVYIIEKPIRIQNCNIKNLPVSLYSPGRNAYGTTEVSIDNCLIHLNVGISGDGGGFIDCYTLQTYITKPGEAESQSWFSCVGNITMTNSTIYSTGMPYTTRFIRNSNANFHQQLTSNKGSFKMTNCTLIFPYNYDQFANNPYNNANYTVSLHNNIFYDVSGLRRINGGNATLDVDVNSNAIISITKDADGSDTNYAVRSEIVMTGTPAVLDINDSAKGGMNLSFSCPGSTATGDPRWN